MILFLSIIGAGSCVVYFYKGLKRYLVMEHSHEGPGPDYHKERMNLMIGIIASVLIVIYNAFLILGNLRSEMNSSGMLMFGQFIQLIQIGRMFIGLYLYPSKIEQCQKKL